MINLIPHTFSCVCLMTKLISFPATTSILRSQEEILWPGQNTVELEVKDQQGKSCEVQKFQVSVCKCTEAQVCSPARLTDRGTVLGPGAILALLLGILLLLGKCHHLSSLYILHWSAFFC